MTYNNYLFDFLKLVRDSSSGNPYFIKQLLTQKGGLKAKAYLA